IHKPPLARVPNSPKSLLGLGNLRGTVAPVASMRALLGGDPALDAASDRALVLSGPAPVAIAIAGAPILVSVERGEIQTDESVIMARPGEKLLGIFGAGADEAARILDLPGLIAAAFTPRAHKARAQVAGSVSGRNDEDDTVEAQQKLLTFVIAGQEFAFELEDVQEIIVAPESFITVPRSEEVIIGVTEYRETLLPLLSLRSLLGFDPGSSSASSKVVVTRVGGALVGLVADQVKAVLPMTDGEAEPPPPVLAARSGGESQIKAIYRRNGGRGLVSVLAPELLFREDVMNRLSDAQRASGAADANSGAAEGEQYVVFRLAGDEFALPVAAVEEVARIPEQITKIPKTPAFLEGVVNLRGHVLPVIDQRRRFDMPILDNDSGRRLLVVKSERHRAGIIVDSVSEVLRNENESIDAAPDLSGQQSRLVLGVINLERSGRMIMVLDPAELLSHAERGLLDAFQLEGAPDTQ
ncbi:MAG: chemotaxis protein CheW, partial [Caulobacterales bacterium]